MAAVGAAGIRRAGGGARYHVIVAFCRVRPGAKVGRRAPLDHDHLVSDLLYILLLLLSLLSS